MPEKRYKIFKQKDDIDESPDDSTNMFQCNIIDRLDRLKEHFKNIDIQFLLLWNYVFITLLLCFTKNLRNS